MKKPSYLSSTMEQLTKALDERYQESIAYRFKKASSGVKNPLMGRFLRRDIARIKTQITFLEQKGRG